MPEAHSRTSGAPLRVLLVGPVAADDGGNTTGGVAAHVSNLARSLEARGHEVAVYADNASPGPAARAEFGRLYRPVSRRGALAKALGSRGLGAYLRAFRSRTTTRECGWKPESIAAHAVGLHRAIADFAPDVIHYHHAEMRPYYGRLAGASAPALITSHSLSSFRDEGPGPRQRLAAENLAAADVVLAVSPDAAEALAGLVQSTTPRFVPNGIDVEVFATDPGTLATDDPGARPLVLYVGWLAQSKGVEDLVDAMAVVVESNPTATLALVGPEIDLTVQQLRDRWSADGGSFVVSTAVGQDEVVRWLHAADVFVLPSRVREGQSRVVIEAFAAGVPVVATGTGAVADLLGQGRLGVLAPPDNPAGLAAAIESVLADPASARDRSAAAREAASEFDSSRVVVLVESAYRDAIAIHEGARA